MKNQQRDEFKEAELARQTVRVLETGRCDEAGDEQVSELGRLLRQSASHHFPDSNGALREQLLAELEGENLERALAAKPSLTKSDRTSSRTRLLAGIAAGALVAVGGWWLYQPNEGVRLGGGVDYISKLDLTEFEVLEKNVGPNKSEVAAQEPHSVDGKGRPATNLKMFVTPRVIIQPDLDEFEEELQLSLAGQVSDHPFASDSQGNGGMDMGTEGKGFAGPGSGVDAFADTQGGRGRPGANYDDLDIVVPETATEEINIGGAYANGKPLKLKKKSESLSGQTADGLTIQLPELAKTETNTVVSVPDGGTVLLGGIRRTRDGKLSSDATDNRLTFSQERFEDQYALGNRYKGKARGGELSPEDLSRKRRFAFAFGKGYFEQSGEQYTPIHENQFISAVGGKAISTFSIDVDSASYSNMRRFLNSGQLPPRDSVRIEELVNYFQYDYPQPEGEDPFSVNMELASCPWSDGHKLLRVGLKGKEVHVKERPATNVVYLIDVSGSMNTAAKLPLLKRGFQMMTKQLGENDRVSIVTYAGNAGVALEPTSGDNTKVINDAIERLTPGGSTHGSAGIELAYKLAQQHFITGGVNKVILATDGDLNVGVTSDNALVDLIKQKASEGVFLTVLGFGTGNLQDGKLEKLADNGNGHYAYIDSNREAHRVLVQQLAGSLVTIAKDVKIQIEFNPAEVKSYRLLGYENRMLATKDFDNDQKDAGEIGAGHTVTAIYEIEPTVGAATPFAAPAEMKYQTPQPPSSEDKQKYLSGTKLTEAALTGELATLALRYKKPSETVSKRIDFVVKNDDKSFTTASDDFRFAASVAGFGMILRGSEFAGIATPEMVLEVASEAMGDDATGYRAEFIDLVRKAMAR